MNFETVLDSYKFIVTTFYVVGIFNNKAHEHINVKEYYRVGEIAQLC